MEWWAILALVLGSNIIMLAGSHIRMKKELEHARDQLEKKLKAEREADTRKREWQVRDETLVKLRDALAQMAWRLEWSVDLAAQLSGKEEEGLDRPKMEKELARAVKEWDEFITGGVFYETLHMQYERSLKVEVHHVFGDYQSAFLGIRKFWRGEKGEEVIGEAKDILKKNAYRVTSIQEEIMAMREGKL